MKEIEKSIQSSNEIDDKNIVMYQWLFFFDGEEDGWTFVIEAKDHEQAFERAYEMWGPQVQDMYYRLIS